MKNRVITIVAFILMALWPGLIRPQSYENRQSCESDCYMLLTKCSRNVHNFEVWYKNECEQNHSNDLQRCMNYYAEKAGHMGYYCRDLVNYCLNRCDPER